MSTIKHICKNVDKLILKFNTRDPFEICKRMDIHIHYKDLGTTLKAYYFYQSRIKNIVINSLSGEIVRKILCAHELGHATLHGNLSAMYGFQELELFDTIIPTEYEANLFAAELIVSDDDLLEKLNDLDKSFFSIARELCVPIELLDFKFRVLKNKGCCLESPCFSPANFLKNDIPGCFQPD